MSRTYRKDHYEHDPYNETKHSRDKKKWYKANKIAKNLTKTQERAKSNNAMRHVLEDENEMLPKFFKHNDWDWN